MPRRPPALNRPAAPGESRLRSRALRRIGVYGLLLAAALAYLALCRAGLGFPCLFLEYGGFKCPSCGATRALVSLLHFDFSAAVAANPVFALAIYPIAGLLALDDFLTAVGNAIQKRDRLSLLRFLCGSSKPQAPRGGEKEVSPT